MLPLYGMRALVTGGAQGIGAGLCIGLSKSGAAVAVVDLQLDKAKDLANTIVDNGGVAIAISADISSSEGCRRAIDSTVAGLGGLDILVNCAAPGRNQDMLGKLADADWDIHQQIVVNSAVQLADLATGHLGKSGNGVIINIGSTTGGFIAVDQCSWPYHISKAALDHLTRFLAVRLGSLGIRVNSVSPGLVDREIGQKLTDSPQNKAIIEEVTPLRRAGTVHDIANAVVFLSSKQSSYITGQNLTVDGGLGVVEVFGASLRAYKAGLASL
jgi:NAD(P)-dependent dehydrogenase (short-subunit alcohol dehydrogenase family)